MFFYIKFSTNINLKINKLKNQVKLNLFFLFVSMVNNYQFILFLCLKFKLIHLSF